MGKIRKRKQNKGSINIAVSSPTEEEVIEDSKENVIQTIIDQLQTVNVEEKYCGLQTFAMLIENPETLEQILNRDLLKIIAPLLIDQAASIRNAAAGCLRNVSVINSDSCDVLMENDIMTPLICYFHQYTETWTPDLSSNTKYEDIDTFVQCTNLLLNICESSDLAVKYLVNSKVLDSIFPRCLDLQTFGHDVVVPVLQCLLVVLEENPEAIGKVQSSSERQLKELLFVESDDPSSLLIRTLTSGIIIIISEEIIETLPTDIMNQIFKSLAKTLSVDHRLASNQLSSSVPLGDAAGKFEALVGKKALELGKQIKTVLQIIDAQINALEIIGNISVSADRSGEPSGQHESSESDEEEDEEVESRNIDEANALNNGSLQPAILEAYVSLELYEKVWARTQMPPQNVLLILKEYEGSQIVYNKLLNLQIRALLCMNNLLLALPLEVVGGVNGVYKIWVEAGKIAFKQNSENLEVLEAATTVMRAALDKIKLKTDDDLDGSKVFHELALSDIEIMFSGIKDCKVAEIRSNLIRMIGSLALLLVNKLNDTTSNVICMISEFILDQANKENDVWVLAEAIDTIIDLYAEDDTDLLAARLNLLHKLKALAPILKSKARQQKKCPKAYRVLVNTTITNLPRFIKYKSHRLDALNVKC